MHSRCGMWQVYARLLVSATGLLVGPVALAAEPVQRFNPNIDLPDSEGRELVLRACTKCHELGGLSAYAGYWNREQWLEMVVSMVKNGAELKPAEQETVTDYLTRHFGRLPVPTTTK